MYIHVYIYTYIYIHINAKVEPAVVLIIVQIGLLAAKDLAQLQEGFLVTCMHRY